MFLSGFATYGRPARKVREHLSANSDRRIEYPDSLRLTYLYIDGIEALDIAGDTLLAERLWRQAVAEDSTYAPALYRLAQLTAARGDTKGAAALAARGISCRLRRQVVCAALCPCTALRGQLCRGAAALPASYGYRPARSRQLPYSGSAVCTHAAAVFGHCHARYGADALRPSIAS